MEGGELGQRMEAPAAPGSHLRPANLDLTTGIHVPTRGGMEYPGVSLEAVGHQRGDVMGGDVVGGDGVPAGQPPLRALRLCARDSTAERVGYSSSMTAPVGAWTCAIRRAPRRALVSHTGARTSLSCPSCTAGSGSSNGRRYR
ncbi:MAG: hypothetical protein ACYDH5_02275 [Acidimicrobiales bacterium]